MERNYLLDGKMLFCVSWCVSAMFYFGSQVNTGHNNEEEQKVLLHIRDGLS